MAAKLVFITLREKGYKAFLDILNLKTVQDTELQRSVEGSKVFIAIVSEGECRVSVHVKG
jgi:hypothetical protein